MIFSEKPKKSREFPEFCDSAAKSRREFWQSSGGWMRYSYLHTNHLSLTLQMDDSDITWLTFRDPAAESEGIAGFDAKITDCIGGFDA